MPNTATLYQCPACTGPLRFDGGSGKLACDHCGNSYETAVIEALAADKERAAAAAAQPEWATEAAGSPWSDAEKAGLRIYSCPACAAEIICDASTAATSCAYCGNPAVVPKLFSGSLRPDYVLPFRLEKPAALEALQKHYKGKRFLPREFTQQNHIEEIRGIYVPFWLFDCQAEADVCFRATRVHSSTVRDEQITVTEHFRLTRGGQVAFQKIPVDGSTKMPDAHMDAIEPYDYKELRPFSTAYLPGFQAERYDVDAATSAERANVRIRKSVEESFSATVAGYGGCTTEYANIALAQGEVKYALLPVWMLNTRWKNQTFTFAMNGQTGKLIGDLPVAWPRVAAWFAGIAAPLAAVAGLLLYLLGEGL
ncbi:MAG: hypothetical protein LBS96_01245 [Oscillospiraceae bacterium]|jgi:DNA-directed RNA polymerase subunit RPC12/RpoP|nr:hypothetical protein [Oscillospiraceae bacterium]